MPDFISSYIHIEQNKSTQFIIGIPEKMSSQPFGIKHSPKTIKRH